MKVQEIPEGIPKRIANYRWDRIIEKHEGPWTWDYLLEHNIVEFLNVNGVDVLLPIDRENHSNITITRCIVSDDKQTLTIFLQDTTWDTGIFAGYLAVCEKVPGEEWYIAIVYRECWVNRIEEVNRTKGQ